MKKVNGMTVYEPEDPCALDEYSEQLEKDLTAKFDKIEDENEQESTDILTLQNKVTDLEQEVEEQQGQITELQNKVNVLEDQIPTGQASGNPIYINDSSNLEAKLRLNGGDKQETRTNNLYNSEVNVSGYLNQTGEVVSNTNWVITDYIPVIELLDYFTAGNSNLTDGDGVYGAYYNADKELISTFPYSTYKTETATITTPENCAYIKFSIYKYQDNTKTFDFYTDAPTPNYQSKVETVGSNTQLFDKDNANTISGAYVDSSGNIGNGGANSQTLYIPITGGKTYTVSKKVTSYGTFRIGTTAEVPALNVQGIDVVSKNGTDTSATITTSSNAKYLTIFCIRTDFDNMQEILDSIKIEEGDKATPYSPHGMGSVEIEKSNKQLFNIKDLVKGMGALNLDEEDFVTVTVDNTSGTSINYYNVYTNISKMLKTNSNYFLVLETKSISGTGNIYVTSQQNGASQISQNLNKSFSALTNGSKTLFPIKTALNFEKARYMLRSFIEIPAGQSGSITFRISVLEDEPDLETFEYVKHEQQTKIMPIQQEMLEGDYIEDVEHHGWNKIVLTGNETYGFASESVQPFRLNLSDAEQLTSSQDIAPNVYCTHFTPVAWNSSKAEMDAWTTALVGKQLAFGYRKITTLEDWKAYLAEQYSAGTPVTVYYKLATPLDLELTEEQKEAKKINTYKNITNIAVDNNLATLDVTYKKDQNTVNQNYENRIAALEAAILS